ncbi:SCO family protein [Variovorax saccharolyticus]|uniref:SCO family protein n=1 Tax=Variovorax saccharolyticus TaxID=3053516 RepID=UPI002575E892|nr:SCO family protein [Variovorax sp. J22R187]MDM0019119.1 SCO family protein [Variovorax sp. J22R187]
MNNRRLLLAGLGAASLGAIGAQAGVSEPTRPSGGRQRIPNVELKTHTGKTVRFYDDLVRGKIVAINMMYADCEGTCPLTTANLVRVQELLGAEVGKTIFMYSITVRPERDTPQDLADYAEMHEVKPGWLFLTGTRESVEQVRLALGFYDPDPAVDKEATRHTGMLRIGNDPFDRWGMTPALAAPEQIVRAIQHVDRKLVAPGSRSSA